MDRIHMTAQAKINLGLDVIRRKENGYHEMKMVMQTIDLCDELDIEITPEPEIRISTGREDLPGDQSNLIWKAANLLMQEFGVTGGIRVTLKKNIPMAAGMAGGSADAAAVMIAVNELFELGLSRQELMDRGVKIGADVPFCILKGTALAEGIGEILTPLNGMPDCTILIAKPGVDVPTKYIFENLHVNERRLEDHPDMDHVLAGIEHRDLYELSEDLGNILELVTVAKHPVIGQIKAFLKERGAVNALMSGSGPTVFAIYDDADKAERDLEELRETGLAKDLLLTKPYNTEV